MSFLCLLKPNSVEITAGKNSTFSQQEKWHDSRRWQLSVATEQPELEGPREGYCNFRGSGKATEASGDGSRATEVSGDSRKEVGASEDSDQKGATKVRDSKTKAEAEF